MDTSISTTWYNNLLLRKTESNGIHSFKDVIKTRYQNDLSQPNPLHTLKQLYRSEGIKCFFRGKIQFFQNAL